MVKIEAFGNQILVEPIEKKEILVGDKSPLCEYGTVVSVGSDVKYIKVGDTIGHTVWGVNHLDIDDKRYYFIPEDARFILAKLTL